MLQVVKWPATCGQKRSSTKKVLGELRQLNTRVCLFHCLLSGCKGFDVALV
jgi:hypothetical protein